MSRLYEVCVTNPPYMGSRNMDEKLSQYLRKIYSTTKTDLFAAFIEKGFKYTKEKGFNSQVTMQSWMFLSSFEELRKFIIQNKSIVNMVNMGNMVMGIAFGTAATIFRNIKLIEYIGKYDYISFNDRVQRGKFYG